MKKYLMLVFFSIMFIPFMVNAETCDVDKISINSITVAHKSENVEELDDAIVNGKSIKLNLSMSEIGDNIEYQFIIKNDSNEDYEIDKTGLNLNSAYIDYLFETDDNSNIVKANSSKNVTLKVEYKNEVPEDKFENGTYSDNKTITVNLSSENNNILKELIKNPNTKTQSYIFIILLILLANGTSYIILKKNKKKIILLILGITIIIPIGAYALCKYEIKIVSNIEINKKTFLYTHYPQTVGEQVENITFDNLDDALNDFNHDYIIRITTNKDNIVEELDLVYIFDNNTYILPGGYKNNNYLKTVEEFKSIFREEYCEKDELGYSCYKDNIRIRKNESGFVSVSDNSYYCLIYEDGNAFCSND